MHNKIILDSFEKARNEEKRERGNTASNTKCAELLSAIVSEKFSYHWKSLYELHKDADKNHETEIKQPQVTDALCQYLGYENYRDFVIKNAKVIDNPIDQNIAAKSSNKNKKIRNIILVSLFVAIIAIVIYISIDKTRWMVWENNNYVEVKFDANKYDVNQLKVYKLERINHFRKVLVNCDTLFFNKDGSVKIWYGKNAKKELEYFTDLALHPETGKTLKPITKYMIDKYICVDN